MNLLLFTQVFLLAILLINIMFLQDGFRLVSNVKHKVQHIIQSKHNFFDFFIHITFQYSMYSLTCISSDDQ